MRSLTRVVRLEADIKLDSERFADHQTIHFIYYSLEIGLLLMNDLTVDKK
jgi:hypothetical protein